MKKQLSILLFTVASVFVVILFSTNSFNIENDVSLDNTVETVNEFNANMYEYDKLHTNDGSAKTAIPKTITKNFNSVDVPAAVFYSEYIDDKWYTGTPELTGSVVKLGPDIWQATYTGNINY